MNGYHLSLDLSGQGEDGSVEGSTAVMIRTPDTLPPIEGLH